MQWPPIAILRPERALPRQTPRPYSQSGTLSTRACSHQYLTYASYIWRAAQYASTYTSLTLGALLPASLLFGVLTSSAIAGEFFAELPDALAAPAFAHRLTLYVGHELLVRLLAGRTSPGVGGCRRALRAGVL